MASQGRPREFDEQKVLDRAMLLFWKKGYRNTSISDLTTEMQINRPSMYSAFGDKAVLFQKVLQHYIRKYAGKNMRLLETEQHITTSITNFLKQSAKIFTKSDLPKGCLVACHLSDSELDTESKKIIQALVDQWSETLVNRFHKAILLGEIDHTMSPQQLASLVICILSGMSHAARNGATFEHLDSMIDAFVKLLGRSQ